MNNQTKHIQPVCKDSNVCGSGDQDADMKIKKYANLKYEELRDPYTNIFYPNCLIVYRRGT